MSTAARIDELLPKFEENPRRYFAPLANEYRKAGDLDQAIAICREHLPKQPGHMSGHIVFGQALFERGDLDEAQQVFEAALVLDPENLIALRHLGDIARMRGDAGGARRWYGRVLDADPRNDDIAALLASLPPRATPVVPASVVAPAEPTPPGLAYDDEPAWHTPEIPLVVTAPSVAAAAPAGPAMPADAPAMDLLDLEAFGEAPPPAVAAAPVPEALASGLPEEAFHLAPADVVREASAEIAVASALLEGFAPASGGAVSDAALVEFAPTEDDAPVRSALAEAIGAFSSHDPIASVADLAIIEAADAWPEVTATPTEVEPTSEGHDAFEEGLLAIEWPDADALAVRPLTPSLPEPFGADAPVAEQPLADLPLAEPALADLRLAEVPRADESLAESPLAEAPLEAPVAEASAEQMVESAAEAAVEGETAGDVEVTFEIGPVLEVESAIEAEPAIDGALDEDPPLSASELPWLAAAEEEREAEAQAVGAEDASTEPDSAFVTETMAELLVAQGFVPRAVSIYEELVRRRPFDDVLTSRLAELRLLSTSRSGAPEPTLRTPGSATPLRTTPIRATPAIVNPVATPRAVYTPVAVPLVAPAARRTARAWLSELAACRVVRRTPMAGDAVGPTSPSSTPTPADGLSALFGGVMSAAPADEVAARSLASAFGGAPVETAAPLFGESPAASANTGAPAEGRAAVESDPAGWSQPSVPPAEAPDGGAIFSFDRFFPDPALASGRPPFLGAAAPSAAEAPSSPPAPASTDLAEFASWLKGLSKS